MMFRKVSIRSFIFLAVIFSRCFTDGLKCELKGLLNNRVQCLLHDRGINTAEDVVNISGTLTWMTKLTHSHNSEKFQSWKFGDGLDRNKTFFGGNDPQVFKKHVHSIMPDTRWCGDVGGDSPTTHEDLMYFVNTDKCCKQHDQCVSIIEVNQQKYDLSNVGLLVRYHCDCEKEFRKCLKTVNTRPSNKIGYTYFTILGPQCFKEEYPVTNCTKKKANRCMEFGLDRKQEKKYQWFDVPLY